MVFGHLKISFHRKNLATKALSHKGYTKIEVSGSGFKVQRLQPKDIVDVGKRHLKIDMKTVALAGFFVPLCLGGRIFILT